MNFVSRSGAGDIPTREDDDDGGGRNVATTGAQDVPCEASPQQLFEVR